MVSTQPDENRPLIAWHALPPTAIEAVLDVAEAVAAGAVADALARADRDTEAAFWCGVEFQRRYEDHVRGIVEWAAKPPPRTDTNGHDPLSSCLNEIRETGALLAKIRDAAGPDALTRYCHATWATPARHKHERGAAA